MHVACGILLLIIEYVSSKKKNNIRTNYSMFVIIENTDPNMCVGLVQAHLILPG